MGVTTEEQLADDNFFDFKCPHCGGAVSFPTSEAGHLRDCPECTQCLILPAVGDEMGSPLPFPLTTPRLVLRRLRRDDLDGLLKVLSDDEMYRFAWAMPMDENQITRWLENDGMVQLTSQDQPFSLGLESQTDGELIGYVTLQLNDLIQGSLNIFVACPHQKKGYATEAMAVMLDFCFDGISLHRVCGYCDSRNLAARRVLEKVGMRMEGEFLKNSFLNGKWEDTVYYALLDEEYRATDASETEAVT